MFLQQNMDAILPIIEKTKDPELQPMFDLLQERIDYPESFVTLLGETSSGKSSLINGLLGKEVLPVSSSPTTGTVVELYEYEEETDITPYALLKNARLRQLTMEQFRDESAQSSSEVSRLRLNIPNMPQGLQGMRLFDTPGYGSIHKEHEDVLKDFIPNSDVIIYVVNYRVGLGENDAVFLQYIQHFLQEDIRFFLVINRAPETATVKDVRIKEIIRYAQDLLHTDVTYFIIPSIPGEGVKLPVANDLWNAVRQEVQSEHRKHQVEHVLQNYQIQLLQQAEYYWQQLLALAKVSNEELVLLQQSIQELQLKKTKANLKIDETFERLDRQIPKYFADSRKKMNQVIEREILSSNKWASAEECTGYVQTHLMPRYEKLERKQISYYIEQELTKLNMELEELVNEAIVNFQTKIEMISNHFEPIVEGISRKIAHRATDGALKTFLARYGGRGGAGAGVANVAKKGLKYAGKLVGKTFSRETHNALASFLKKIGATSTRNLSIAVSIFIEGVFYVIEANRWQIRLIGDVEKGTLKWEQDTVETVIKDLKELRKVNHENMDENFDDYLKMMNSQDLNASSVTYVEDIERNIKEIQELVTKMEKERVTV
ncbi:dynamin family protein [Bacillus sp. T3]|uniref:dynamin family protein n=1 Tax=Bacillus sp. T3 TaxID=467262 RepID=UPI002981FB0B|nr:dynamin family protein [Bacillus sp. T3]